MERRLQGLVPWLLALTGCYGPGSCPEVPPLYLDVDVSKEHLETAGIGPSTTMNIALCAQVCTDMAYEADTGMTGESVTEVTSCVLTVYAADSGDSSSGAAGHLQCRAEMIASCK